VDVKRAARALQDEREHRQLQVELVNLQRNAQINGRRVAIVFEGRDAAEKVGRFVDSSNT
jgi:polyphosphate kinase 2 (PPK2 family)